MGAPEGGILTPHLATAAIRCEGFQVLRQGRAAEAAELAALTGLHQPEVEQTLAAMVSFGAAEVDKSGLVIGIHGLSLRPTAHRLILSGFPLHTWCALDAIGIPAALGEDARIATTCAHCGRTLEIEMRRGEAPADLPYVVWYPTAPCSHVVNDFCSQANLFCDESHLEAWRATAGHPPGKVLRLVDVQALGQEIWRNVR